MYHRYKPYRRYRNEIQDVFNPSLKKANTPNYYQMKGRTIQQTPLKMKNYDTKTITRRELEKMYEKLIKYKFPIPTYERVPIYLPIIIKVKDAFQGDPLKFTGDDLWTHANDLMQKKYSMLLASGDWHYECIGVQFLNNSGGIIDYNKRYAIYWDSDVMQGGSATLLAKNNTDSIVADATSLVASVVPEDPNDLSILSTTVSATSRFTFSETSIQNLDPSPQGKALYPFIDTRLIPSQTLYGEFRLSYTMGASTEISMTLFVVAIPD